MTDAQRWQHALEIQHMIEGHAPDFAAGQVARNQYMSTKRATDSAAQFLQDRVSVLYDGLTYGNWPWSPTAVDGILAKNRPTEEGQA